ncbi:histone-fold-containing protein [Blyttiomyces helicus]|uniref:Histone-fold-containing protein n=1 Tax=Blyttiomyces helicus TaxID=388810 RepID=A0A4P9W9G1_9FUNG|nr:histone-fold-containing protein [Blyttiomyces helicus]|eukprot:RKO86846.1 histone-fold-containing protein [Blyttiomyces helicus]
MAPPTKTAPGSQKPAPDLVAHGPKKVRKKKPVESFAIYIYRVLVQVHPDIRMSKKGMSVMCDFMQDIFERVAGESAHLINVPGKKRMTLSARDIHTAVKLVLPGNLAVHATAEGNK